MEGVVKISNLATLRKEKGLTQEALARKSGVNRVLIARFETGRSNPTLDTLQKIALALDVPIDAIVSKGA
jgi:transcriptional regulator with XRE-family HTH domain